MAASAPRISRTIHELVTRLDDERLPLAEIARRVCAEAERRGYARPSYEGLRVLIHRVRRERAQIKTREVLHDVAFRARPAEAILDHVSGVGVPPLRR